MKQVTRDKLVIQEVVRLQSLNIMILIMWTIWQEPNYLHSKRVVEVDLSTACVPEPQHLRPDTNLAKNVTMSWQKWYEGYGDVCRSEYPLHTGLSVSELIWSREGTDGNTERGNQKTCGWRDARHGQSATVWRAGCPLGWRRWWGRKTMQAQKSNTHARPSDLPLHFFIPMI